MDVFQMVNRLLRNIELILVGAFHLTLLIFVYRQFEDISSIARSYEGKHVLDNGLSIDWNVIELQNGENMQFFAECRQEGIKESLFDTEFEDAIAGCIRKLLLHSSRQRIDAYEDDFGVINNTRASVAQDNKSYNRQQDQQLHENGCKTYLSYKSLRVFPKFETKVMTTCTDSCTNETKTATKYTLHDSKEECIRNLQKKVDSIKKREHEKTYILNILFQGQEKHR